MDPVTLYKEVYSNDPNYKIGKRRYESTLKFLKACGVHELDKKDWKSMRSLDISCGRGEIVDLFGLFYGYKALGTEIVEDLADNETVLLVAPFKEDHISELPKVDVVTCFDVLEHLEEKAIDSAFDSIAKTNPTRIFFSISTRESYANKNHGKACGKELHLTVKPPSWWISRLTSYWPFSCIAKADQREGTVFINLNKREKA